MPVFKASNGRYYTSGPGHKVYVRMSLEGGRHTGKYFTCLCCNFYKTRVKCYMDNDPLVVVKVYIGKSNPDSKGTVQRSEAVTEQYGHIQRYN